MLTKLLPVVMWKIEKLPEECVDLVKVISRQNIEVASWLLLAACDEIQEE